MTLPNSLQRYNLLICKRLTEKQGKADRGRLKNELPEFAQELREEAFSGGHEKERKTPH
jgi:hypothetical protein